MSALSDLTTATSNLATAATSLGIALQAFLANQPASGGVAASDAEAAVTAINSVTAQLNAAIQLLTPAAPPSSPTPTPTPATGVSTLPPPPA